ncbi:hypothetical protein FOZ76_20340 [Verticiella sediminum]|uniref:Uncharacterized protein n=1 Tax=Verticiella sediminum TaxID=1247510 RepID=A0A556ABE9_9BURK|nr:hypothetical protein [Verticiella sediminum]TSH90190.1 hypothetical protein FOZ76_20340 [Verticiella sediminum]
MLTAEEQKALRLLHEGRLPADDERLAKLLQGRYIVRKDGRFHITDSGLTELGLARGFGDAIADAILPGAGTNDSVSRRK